MSLHSPAVPKMERKSHLLGELLDFRNDVVHPRDKPSGIETFVGLEHIERDTGIRLGSEQINLAEMTGRRARFYRGDIVYGYLRPYLNKVWRAEFDGLCSVDQYVFRVRPVVDPNYISYFLRSAAFLTTAPVNTTPGQLPRIRSGEIADTPILLPPLGEQRRIAAILDQADDLRRKRRAALERLSQLPQILFSHQFGDVILNTSGWVFRPLSSVVARFEGGKNIVADDPGSPNPLRVLKISAIQEQGFVSGESKPLPDGYVPPHAHYVRKGDLLLSRANTAERVGMVARVQSDSDQLVLPDKILRFVWRCDNDTCPDYWLNCFQASQVRSRLEKLATGTSGSMKNISQEKLLSLSLGMPPLDIQRAFASRVAEIDKLKASHRTHLAHLDALFASLQHRAFRGEL